MKKKQLRKMRREVLEESSRVMQDTINALTIALIMELPTASAKRAAVTLDSLSRNYQRHYVARKIIANVATKAMFMAINGKRDEIVTANYDQAMDTFAAAFSQACKH